MRQRGNEAPGHRVKVLCTLRFTEQQLDKLRAVSPRLMVAQRTCHDAEEVREALDEDTEILYAFHLPDDLLPRAPRLRWVQLHSAGADHLLDHPIMNSDVLVTTSSGIHATPIAEYAFASILAWSRRVPEMLYYQNRREWPKGRWDLFVGQELRGATLGVVGYGSIGREVGRIGKCWGMRVVAAKRSVRRVGDTGYRVPGTGDAEAQALDRIYPPERLREMLAECDFVVISLPLTPETRGLIGEEELRAMKPNAYLVNVSRGGIVDEPALIKALQEGWIAGAGLDVFEMEPLPPDSPLYDLDNVILSPHVAGFSPHYDQRASDLFVENLRRYLAGQELLNLVDKEAGY
ncbi:MAG: D-2-hydroxyacid dehydrogenase [Chloroflexi bacterium]|nr:D-2-hydroxyacid dehydrogenase [Chloroflexota bacterium]